MRAMWAVALLLFAVIPARAQDVSDVDARNTAIAAACQLVRIDDTHTVLDRRCRGVLAFDTRAYFGAGTIDDDRESPGGLVDAHYNQSFRGPIWAFAIDNACPGIRDAGGGCRPDDRRLLLRAVTMDRAAKRPPEWVGVSPRSASDMRRFLDAVADWREADLRACPGALKTLNRLSAIPLPAFDDQTRRLIEGRSQTREIIVTADPDSVWVRAGTLEYGFATQDMGQPGTVGAWAKQMLDVVRSCLKPTSAPAPWAEPAP